MVQQAPATAVGRGAPLVDQPTFNTHILILPIPALSAEGWTTLETARLALHDHHMLTMNGIVLRIVPEATFSIAELSALFVAAQVPLSVCAAFMLSGPSLPVAKCVRCVGHLSHKESEGRSHAAEGMAHRLHRCFCRGFLQT